MTAEPSTSCLAELYRAFKLIKERLALGLGLGVMAAYVKDC